MSKYGDDFRKGASLVIPEDIQPGPGWTEQMLELADHIGNRATLQLVERFGGEQLYVPVDPHSGDVAARIREVIGARATEILCKVYRREFIEIPAAKYALARAQRHDIIAAVRSGDISVSRAARILGTSRTYLSFLVNQTDEGTEGAGWSASRSGTVRLPGQLDLFGEPEDEEDSVR
ncbi:MAG TPA: hypothetical protein VF605_11850 [Allosphingosinicella sp.]|jgi:hypothetical protein